ncbi:MAG: hypothetical protein ACJ78Q_05850, partial [Chloroflexia bacterium]
MSSVSYTPAGVPGEAGDEHMEPTSVISAIFTNQSAAQAAVRELREIGIPAEDISLISRKQEHPEERALSGAASASSDGPGEDEPTYRATGELSNDVDLPAGEAETAGRQTPVFTDFVVPPDEPLGGSERLGLSRDGTTARRDEAYTNPAV